MRGATHPACHYRTGSGVAGLPTRFGAFLTPLLIVVIGGADPEADAGGLLAFAGLGGARSPSPPPDHPLRAANPLARNELAADWRVRPAAIGIAWFLTHLGLSLLDAALPRRPECPKRFGRATRPASRPGH